MWVSEGPNRVPVMFLYLTTHHPIKFINEIKALSAKGQAELVVFNSAYTFSLIKSNVAQSVYLSLKDAYDPLMLADLRKQLLPMSSKDVDSFFFNRLSQHEKAIQQLKNPEVGNESSAFDNLYNLVYQIPIVNEPLTSVDDLLDQTRFNIAYLQVLKFMHDSVEDIFNLYLK